MGKLKVGVLGASGAAGMEFVRALDNHPYFEIAELYGNRSAGDTLEQALAKQEIAIEKSELSGIRSMTTKNTSSIRKNLDLICSALPSDVARIIEGECAAHTPVISTASANRYKKCIYGFTSGNIRRRRRACG